MAKTHVTRVKPQKAKQKKPFWSTIWYYVKSLFSNGIVYEIGRTKKWFYSIILFVVSTIITVIPTAVQQFRIKGSDFLAGAYDDNFYYGLYGYATDDTAAPIIFNDDFSLSKTTVASGKFNETDAKTSYDSNESWWKPVYSFSRDGYYRDLDIYVFTDDAYLDGEKIGAVLKNLDDCNTGYALAESDAKKLAMESEKHTRTSSYIAFFPDKVYVKGVTTKLQNKTLIGDYNAIKYGYEDLPAGEKTLRDLVTYKVNLTDTTKTTKENMIAIDKNFALYLDKAYEGNGRWAAWQTVLIIGSINAGIMLLAGIIMWALTRNKDNPNRDLKVTQAYSMAFWLSLTPAILGMGLGFMISAFSYMSFILCYVMRVMYMTTKFLRPPVQR